MPEGTSYSTSAKTIEGYTFVRAEGDAPSGTMDGHKVVTYVYEKDAPPAPQPVYYTLTTNYVDESGNAVAIQEIAIFMPEGTSYSTSAKTIEGYTFVRTEGDAPSGTMDGHKVVTYVYEKKVAPPPVVTYDYTVVAEYYTNGAKDGSKNIASVADVLALPAADEVAGTYKNGNRTYNGVSYNYTGITKSGSVYTLRYDRTYVAPTYYTLKVRWISQDGDVLANQLTQLKLKGASYTTEQKAFEGYTFVRTTGDAVSGIMNGSKTVTYIYAKNAPPVEPDPVEPDPVEPDPVEPDPVEPDPVEPDPVEPDPVEPDPVEPDPVEPDPVEPDPEDPIDIPDDDVPLADVPQTGDLSVLWMAMSGASAAGLIGLGVTRKKKDEE